VKVASEQATVVKPEKPEMIKLSEILKYCLSLRCKFNTTRNFLNLQMSL
jgi:hypothetical protein